MVSELDVRRDLPGETQETLQDASLDVLEPDRKDTLEHSELEVCVPLHRELVVWHVVKDHLQLGEQALLVTTLHEALVLGHHEGADRSERSGQADLEPAGDRHEAVTLQAREDAI